MSWYRSAFDFGKEVAQEVSEDDVPSMSGAIAYFAVLSLPPLLAMLVWLAGVFFPEHVIEGMVTGEAGDVLGEDTAAQLGTMLQEARDVGAGSVFVQVLGIAALVLGATGAFVQLQRALNRAWDVAPDPERSGIKTTIMKRLTSFGMILVIAFLMAASLVLSAVISFFSDQIGEIIGGAGWVMVQIADVALPLALFTLLFAAIFKVLPDANVPWRVVWGGGFFTAVLFVVGKFLIGMFLSRAEVGEAFGAAGSLVVLLVWIYYTSLLLLVGAEFTQVWARRRGTRIVPDEGAVRVVSQTRVAGRPDGSSSGDAPSSEEQTSASAVHTHSQPRPPQPRSGITGEPADD